MQRHIFSSILVDSKWLSISDVSSAKNLVELLDLIYECSGLIINSPKSEFLWLGTDRDSNDQVLNFFPPEDTVHALGVHAFLIQQKCR